MAPKKKTPDTATPKHCVASGCSLFSPEKPLDDGCGHLAQLKLLLADLADSYRVCVRYALSYKNRHNLRLGPKEKKFLKLHEDVSAVPGPSKPKKKRTGTVEKIVQAIEKLPMPLCCSCDDCSGRIYACLQCVFVGCWNIHMKQHPIQTNHVIAVDLSHGNLYCSKCADHIYDFEFEQILQSEKSRIDYLISRVKEPDIKRVRYNDWNPTQEELTAIKEGSDLQPCSGLRGLRNMGSTCFMNVILQTFVHNPLLKAHFLSDKHNSALCSTRMCMACEMDKLFSNFFCGDNSPFGPASFLHSMWISHKDLASNEQHDSHEFFISVLNQIHTNCTGNTSHSTTDCRCVIHSVFGGILQSEVICQKCGNVSNTQDPILDVSLDLRAVNREKKKSQKKKGANVVDDEDKEVKYNESMTLYECLDSIPIELDMTPYTSKFIKLRSKKSYKKDGTTQRKNSIKQNYDPIVDCFPSHKYSLFAVVSHQGTLETGHYTSFCKSRDQWFLFDDHNVALASQAEVLNCKAYMCFYQNEMMDYSQEVNVENIASAVASPTSDQITNPLRPITAVASKDTAISSHFPTTKKQVPRQSTSSKVAQVPQESSQASSDLDAEGETDTELSQALDDVKENKEITKPTKLKESEDQPENLVKTKGLGSNSATTTSLTVVTPTVPVGKKQKTTLTSTDKPKPEPKIKNSKKRKDRDPDEPKGAKNAFIYFQQAKRGDIVKANPELKSPEIAKILGQMWRELSDKSEYEKLAAEDKVRYTEAKKEYLRSKPEKDEKEAQVQESVKKIKNSTASKIAACDASSGKAETSTCVPDSGQDEPSSSPEEKQRSVDADVQREVVENQQNSTESETKSRSVVSSASSSLDCDDNAKVGNKKRKERDPDEPKGAKNTFIFFQQAKRGDIVKANPDLKLPEIGKILGQMWRELSDKSEYEKLAAEDKVRYTEAKKEYLRAKDAEKDENEPQAQESVKKPKKSKASNKTATPIPKINAPVADSGQGGSVVTSPNPEAVQMRNVDASFNTFVNSMQREVIQQQNSTQSETSSRPAPDNFALLPPASSPLDYDEISKVGSLNHSSPSVRFSAAFLEKLAEFDEETRNLCAVVPDSPHEVLSEE
ncbi:hypothetical protein HK098_005905 [Nowakowskiella sp. JEL0407]|nr:hypothetical protein HK098_005905 [Nowakowskiella sp. JEL0407]